MKKCKVKNDVKNRSKQVAKTKKPKDKLLKKEKKVDKAIKAKEAGVAAFTGSSLEQNMEQLCSQIDLGAAPGTTSPFEVNQEAFGLYVAGLLDYLARTTQLFLHDGENSVTPGDFWTFCHLALAVYVKECGVSLGGGVQYVPEREGFLVPAALAYVLQYYGKYKEGDMTLVSRYDLTMSADAPPSIIGAGNIPQIGIWPEDYSHVLYDKITRGQDDLNTAFIRSSSPSEGTITDWMRSKLKIVMGGLQRMGLDMIDISKVPEYAPDASQYTTRFYNLLDEPTTTLMRRSTNCHDEIAQFFAYNRPGAAADAPLAAPPMYPIPAKRGLEGGPWAPMGKANWSPEAQISSTIMYLAINSSGFKPGRLNKILKTPDGSKVRTFIPKYKRMVGDPIKKLITGLYTAAVNQNKNFDDGSAAVASTDFPPGQYAVTLMWILNMVYTDRVQQCCPLPFLGGRDANVSGRFWPQAFWLQPMSAFKLPPIVYDFLESIGCCSQNGEIIFPFVRVQDENKPASQLTMVHLGQGTSHGDDYPVYWSNSLAVDVSLGGNILDASVDNALQLEASSKGFINVFPLGEYMSLVAVLNAAYGTIGNIFENMVQNTHSKLTGECSQMLTSAARTIPLQNRFAVNLGGNISTAIEKEPTGKKEKKEKKEKIGSVAQAAFTLLYGVVTDIASSTSLSAADVAKAILYNSRVSGDFTSDRGFRVNVPRGGVIDGFLSSTMAQCFTPNAVDVSPLHGAGVSEFVAKKHLARENTALKDYAAAIQSFVSSERLLPEAPEVICSGAIGASTFIPVLGQILAVFSGPAKKLCEKGLGRLICYIVPRSKIGSQNVPLLSNFKEHALCILREANKVLGETALSEKDLKGLENVILNNVKFKNVGEE